MRWIGVVAFICLVGCSDEQGNMNAHGDVMEETATSQGAVQPTPEEYRAGEERFEGLCARCHGMMGRGTSVGPPLVHKIYEPSHHSDFAFMRAARQGVRAHHWKFGNMPPIPGATSDDVTEIIAYVRWLQREAGIH